MGKAKEHTDEELLKDLIEVEASDLFVAGAVLITIGTIITALSLTEVYLTRSPQGAWGIVVGNGIESVGNVVQYMGNEKEYSLEPSGPIRTEMTGNLLQAIGNAGNAFFVAEGINLYRYTFTDSGSRAAMNQENTGGQFRNTASQQPSTATATGTNMQTAEGTTGTAAETAEEETTPEEEAIESKLKFSIAMDGLSSAIQSLGAFLEAKGTTRQEPYPEQGIKATSEYITGIGAFIEAIGSLLAVNEQELQGTKLQVIGAWTQVGAAGLDVYASTSFSASKRREFEENRYTYGQSIN